MTEQTILDGPATPAPLFAYRALRGIFFNSPNDDDYDNDHNKENAPILPPTKTRLENTTTQQSPSPTKRRRIQLSSPAKSILRTPGVPTPRKRVGVSVSFKDARKSVSASPDDRKRSRVTMSMPDAGKVKDGKTSIPEPAHGQGRGTGSVRALEDVKDGLLTTTVSEFDIEAYRKATEKEMKKLIQYGQKMREYARKQDRENDALTKMVEELRAENERLKRKTDGEGEKKREDGKRAQEIMPKDGKEQTEKIVPVLRRSVKPAQDTGTLMRSESATTTETHGTKRPLEFDGGSAKQPERAEIQQSNAKAPVGLGHSNARIVPDRLLAARERVRLKAERRKASETGQVHWAGS